MEISILWIKLWNYYSTEIVIHISGFFLKNLYVVFKVVSLYAHRERYKLWLIWMSKQDAALNNHFFKKWFFLPWKNWEAGPGGMA